MADGTPQFPRLPWYPASFRASTVGWPLIARAVYRELLDIQWDMGGLPKDPATLRAIVGATAAEWRKAWPFVSPKFQLDADGQLRNPRLEQHRAKALELHAKRKDGAAKTNGKRWGVRVVPFRQKGGGDDQR